MALSCATKESPQPKGEAATAPTEQAVVTPVIVTEPVGEDSDDPAIWLHPEDPSQSLILGTDKAGAVFVFDLAGKIIQEKTVTGLARMNNVDVDMTPIDNGGIPVFETEPPERQRPMGIALYKRPSDGVFFAILSRKEGPDGSYLWQYRLDDDGTGAIEMTKVREFGAFSGSGEIEALAVDGERGFLYYSDEGAGIHKYHADPDAPDANEELALFGTTGFTEDREGISIYKIDDHTGYIIVSDQQANAFRIFKREGEPGDPHDHRFVKSVRVAATDSDGSEVTNVALNDDFPYGLFMAMSDDKTFHFYSWKDMAGDDLVVAPNGETAGD
jgi:3-phytase